MKLRKSGTAWRHANIGRLLNNAVRRFEGRVLELMSERGHGQTRIAHVSLTRNLDVEGTRLTELARRASMSKQAMGELVERGVRFAVDDFGTGYSSLARLKELPAQIVKLDRRFVSGVGVDPSDFAVVRAVVEMAHAMGLVCVAEGVETAAQFQVLRDLGVDAYQGWLFSRALPAPDLRALLHRGPLLS